MGTAETGGLALVRSTQPLPSSRHVALGDAPLPLSACGVTLAMEGRVETAAAAPSPPPRGLRVVREGRGNSGGG